jgi:hypothetical protein
LNVIVALNSTHGGTAPVETGVPHRSRWVEVRHKSAGPAVAFCIRAHRVTGVRCWCPAPSQRPRHVEGSHDSLEMPLHGYNCHHYAPGRAPRGRWRPASSCAACLWANTLPPLGRAWTPSFFRRPAAWNHDTCGAFQTPRGDTWPAGASGRRAGTSSWRHLPTGQRYNLLYARPPLPRHAGYYSTGRFKRSDA